MTKANDMIDSIIEQKNEQDRYIQQHKAQEIVMKAQLDTYYDIFSREKGEAGTQFEIIEEQTK